jgi:hypothetical protein
MRRILAFGLGVGSVPLGVGLGFWTAQLAAAPPCPLIGLGTIDLCRPVPVFAPSLCVLFGGAAAALLLTLSIVVLRPASIAPAFALVAAEAGILIGLLASLMVIPFCGPSQLCLGGGLQRFTFWESALIGAVAAAGIVALGCAANSDLRRVNLDAARRAQRWLFNDLSNSASTEKPEAHAG